MLFVDTNVLVYAFDQRFPAKRSLAIDLLTTLAARDLGAVSAQVLGGFLTAVTRRLPDPLTLVEAEQAVSGFVRFWTVYDLTSATILHAIHGMRRYQLPYWDALIWATASLNGASHVLSEDFSDGALIEGVRILNPLRPGFELPL